MLGNSDVYATIAVSDLATAKQFYEQTLGLQVVHEDEGGITYASGNSHISIYPSGNAGTNKGTSASWKVDDIDVAVAELKEKGVNFEHYPDMPGMTLEGDVHVMGELKAAWFKDPEGNTLCVSNEG